MTSTNNQNGQIGSNPPLPAENVQNAPILCKPCGPPPAPAIQLLFQPVQMEENNGNSDGENGTNASSALAPAPSCQPDANNETEVNSDDEEACAGLVELAATPDRHTSVPKFESDSKGTKDPAELEGEESNISRMGAELSTNQKHSEGRAELSPNQKNSEGNGSEGSKLAADTMVSNNEPVAMKLPFDMNAQGKTSVKDDEADEQCELPKVLADAMDAVVTNQGPADSERQETTLSAADTTAEATANKTQDGPAAVSENLAFKSEEKLPQANKGDDANTDAADASASAEVEPANSATSGKPAAMPVRGKVLPGKMKLIDQSEGAFSEEKEAEIKHEAPLLSGKTIQFHDSSGDLIQFSQNDIVLATNNSFYKSAIEEQVCKLGIDNTAAGKKNAAEELLDRFKRGGGRFFKKSQQVDSHYEQVDKESALNKIMRDVQDRIRKLTWLKKELETNLVEQKSCLAETPNEGRSKRKRNRPLSFIESQGQDFVMQEVLRQQSAKAKKKTKGKIEDTQRIFSTNENREFEQGCMRYGWGNWDLVQQLVPGRTREECEEYASMILTNFPDVKARLENEHDRIWVYRDREGETVNKTGSTEQFQQHEVPVKLPPTGDDESDKVCKPSSTEVGACKTESTSSDATGGRPKRKSAISARETIAASVGKRNNATGESSRTGQRKSVGSSIQKTKLKKVNHALLEGLPSAPSSNGKVYEEESSWRFHNPDFPEKSKEQLTSVRDDFIAHMPPRTSSKDLKRLPPAPPIPQLPETRYCKWTFDEESRVLLANFLVSSYSQEKKKIKVAVEDESFLFRMMERDDITVISEGLADGINSSLYSGRYIERCIGSEYHHKVRGFQTTPQDGTENLPTEQAKEMEGWHSMKFSDYFQYLEQRRLVKKNRLDGMKENVDEGLRPNKLFSFTDSDGITSSVDVDDEALYMIDVDLVKLLPQTFQDFQSNFKLPGILPGGSHCMMNAVNANGRPFMGPNLYITPPFSFTHFHQDGHGTVDSGHLCLSGYNEVVMLRRLTERHKCHAIEILTGVNDTYSTLYGLPHRDGLENQPGWPSKEAIRQCAKMGYYPSCFVLKAGQMVHINKGRLHAFRKLSPSPLPESDCHVDLRCEILESKGDLMEDVCISIAWDWMFKGVTSEGINREVSGLLECSRLNCSHHLQSLAIPETSLIFLAKDNIAKHELDLNTSGSDSHFELAISPRETQGKRSEPNPLTVLRGILPSLQYVVSRHNGSVAFSNIWADKTKGVTNSFCVLIESKPNTEENPDTFALDPYGAGDFFCKFCSEELSNVYMHCDGCEKLLDKDFNICSTCHQNEKYKVTHQMHPFNPKSHSILNHTGNAKMLRRARCPCKNGKECQYCSYCTGCSCRCHQRFTLHYRFMGLEKELEILQNVESIVGSDVIPQTAETKARLFSLISEDVPEEDLSTDDIVCQVIVEKKPTNKRPTRATAAKEKDLGKVGVMNPTSTTAPATVSAEAEGIQPGTSNAKHISTSASKISSIEEAAVAGCARCLSEVKTGRPSRIDHADHCPRNVTGVCKVAPSTKEDSASNKPITTKKRSKKSTQKLAHEKKGNIDDSTQKPGDAAVSILNTGKWSEEEHRALIEGCRRCGNEWAQISQEYVPTRTINQVRKKAVMLKKSDGLGKVEGKKEATLHSSGSTGKSDAKQRISNSSEDETEKKTVDTNDATARAALKGPLSEEEHTAFLEGCRLYGNQWTKISQEFVPTRTRDQIKNHARQIKRREVGLVGENEEGTTHDSGSRTGKKSDKRENEGWVIPKKKRKKDAGVDVDVDVDESSEKLKKRKSEELQPNDISDENNSARNENHKAANVVKFTCPICHEVFKFTHEKTAPEKFETHLAYCRENYSEKKRTRARKNSGGKDLLSAKKSQKDETQVSDNESHTEEGTHFNPDGLKPGDGVIVLCGKGENWQATIRRCCEKKGRAGFMIHYTGNKKERENWVPKERVIAFIEKP